MFCDTLSLQMIDQGYHFCPKNRTHFGRALIAVEKKNTFTTLGTHLNVFAFGLKLS